MSGTFRRTCSRRYRSCGNHAEQLTARAGALEATDPERQQLKDQAQTATDQAGELEKARESGQGSIADQLDDQVVEQKLRNHIELMQNTMKVFRDLSEGAATILTEGLAEAVAKADNLKDAFKDIGRQLLKLALQKLVIDQAKGLLSNALGGLFGGGKAAGGPVQAGRLYMVGERGQELFRPQVPGEIVPNYKMRPAMAGGGGNAFNFSINIQSSDGPGVRAALAEAVPVIEGRVSRAVKGEMQADLARPSALRGRLMADTAGLHHAPDRRAHLFADGHRRRRGGGLDVGPVDAVGALDLADQAAGRGAFDLDIVPLQIDAREKTGSIFRRARRRGAGGSLRRPRPACCLRGRATTARPAGVDSSRSASASPRRVRRVSGGLVQGSAKGAKRRRRGNSKVTNQRSRGL